MRKRHNTLTDWHFRAEFSLLQSCSWLGSRGRLLRKGRERLWELVGLQEQPPQSMRQPIPACRKSNRHGGKPTGMRRAPYSWVQTQEWRKMCVIPESTVLQDHVKNQVSLLLFGFFLRLKNYSPMFLNACIIFLEWDKALCKPLKVAVPGQWSPHNSAFISSPQLLLAGIPKCPVRWQQTWLAYAAQYGPRLKQPVHNNKLLVFQISTACYSHTGF